MNRRRIGPRECVLLAVLIAGIGLLGLAGCESERHTQRPELAALRIEASFLPSPGTAGLKHVRLVRAAAFELTGPERIPVLRAEDEVALEPGEDLFRLVLLVPPADLYRIQLTMEGTIAQGGNVSEDGLLYFGEAELADVRAGQSHDVPIQMKAAVTFVALQVTDRGWRLVWTPLADAIGYLVKQTPPPPLPVIETPTSVTDTIIPFPPTYGPAKADISFRVRARFAGGVAGAFSPEASAEFPAPIPPAPVQDLRVGRVWADSLALLWTASGDDGTSGQAAQYDLRRSTSGPILNDAEFAAAAPVLGLPAPAPAGTQERFVVPGLDPTTTYHFALKVADEVPVFSIISNPVSGTTFSRPPSAPADLSVTTLSPVAVRVQWLDTADNEEGFEVERRGPGEVNFVPDTTLVGDFTGTVAYVRPGLDPRTLYRFRVRAVNAGGPSDWSPVAEARTAVPPPRLDSVVAVAPDSVVVTWSFPPPDPTGGFRLERRENAGPFTEVARPDGALRAFGDGAVSPLQTYGYRLLAADGGELSDFSAEVEVTLPDLLPSCDLTPSSLDFGVVLVGSFADASFTITNTGGGLLSGSVTESCGEFAVLSGGGTYSLGAGQSRQVSVRFSPATAGLVQCSIDLGSNHCGAVTASGTGEALPDCQVEPPSLDFGGVPIGSIADARFTITNTGGGLLSGSVTEQCEEFTIVSGGGSYALGAGQARQVSVRFAPAVPGAVECSIDLGTTDCGTVTATGTGEALPDCLVDATSLDFGVVPIGSFADLSFTITNLGGGTLSGSVAEQCGDFAIVSGEGSYALGAGQSRPVSVRYSPTIPGAVECSIDLGNTDCGAVTATGTGEALPACQVDPTALPFGLVPIGSYAEASFTITNTGGGTLSGFVAEQCGDFAIVSGGGSYALGAGQAHPVTVRFTPSLESPVQCTIDLGHEDCADVICTGAGELHPVCELDPADLDFGPVEYGGVVTRSFTITNAGGGILQGVVYLTCPYYTITTGEGGYALAAGESHEVTVEFVAPAAPGSYVCVVETGDNCPGGVTCTATVTDPDAHWWPGFGGNGPDGWVHALAPIGASLAVGGEFNTIGGIASPRIALWNGSAWEFSIDSGHWQWISALVEHEGALHAAGFNWEYSSYSVERWAGDFWDYRGLFDDVVRDLVSFDGWLYAAGDFTTVDGSSLPLIARWTGDGWAAAAAGLSASSVTDLLVSNGVLYAAASVGFGKEPATTGLYRLDGGVWNLVTDTVQGVQLIGLGALAQHDGVIYAATMDVYGTEQVARLDGSDFVAIGTTTGGPAIALASFQGTLFATGLFTSIGGTAVNYVARWDGTGWRALGSGLSGGEPYPRALLSFGNSLYVAGGFSVAGGKNSPNIARWDP